MILVIGSVVLTARDFFKNPIPSRIQLYFFPLSAIAGFLVFRFAGWFRIVAPFDLRSGLTILFLLVVARLLEELIFRFFLWASVLSFSAKPIWAWVLTTLFFSYSHLHAIWFAPESIHGFIIYQTLYTIALGAACGYFIWKNLSIFNAVLVHFAFNLGFFLATF